MQVESLVLRGTESDWQAIKYLTNTDESLHILASLDGQCKDRCNEDGKSPKRYKREQGFRKGVQGTRRQTAMDLVKLRGRPHYLQVPTKASHQA